MKQRLRPSLALLATLALAVSLFLIPSGAATAVTDEASLRSAVEAGGAITMSNDITLTSALDISKAVTIDGGTHALTYNVATSAAITVSTNAQVTMKNLTLNATASGGRGIDLTGSSPHLTLTNSTLKVHTHGICFTQSGDATGAVVILGNSKILNSQVSGSYDTNTTIGNTRGISLYNTKDCWIRILNGSEIKGFGYSINLTGTDDAHGVCDFNNTRVEVTNSEIYGWTAFNVWSAHTIFNITNSHLRGINTSSNYSNSFATIVVNDDIYGYFEGSHADACKFNISGGIIDNYRTGTCDEYLFRIDDYGVTEATFSNNVKFVDNTNALPCAFVAGNQAPTLKFYNYVYNRDGLNRIQGAEDGCTSYYANGALLPLALLPSAS